MSALQCDMSADCAQPVEMIGENGWIYCRACGRDRRACGYEQTRLMRPWELRLIEQGKQLPSYRPITQREATA